MTAAHLTKDEATVQAAAALRGVTVVKIAGEHGMTAFIVSRWAMTRECADLAEVRALLKRMGVEA